MKRAPLGELSGLGQQDKRSRREDEQITRIFAGGLSYSTDWKSLKDHFAQIGEVEFANVLTKPDGSSKGCGMINYFRHKDAARAVDVLHESELDGRHIIVRLDLGADAAKKRVPTLGELVANPPRHSSSAGGVKVTAPAGLPGVKEEGIQLPPEQISRVFVGNLAFSTTWQGLKDHFKIVADVEFASILEDAGKRSKGCGLVNFSTHEEAMQAVEVLNESQLDGRNITVKLDVNGRFKERPPPKNQQHLAKVEPIQYFSLPEDQISRVFVGSLSYETNWQALKDHFCQVGEVEFASVLLNPDRTSKGCGMVNFMSHEDAVRAVELLHNSELGGRKITVKLDTEGRFKERPAPGARRRVTQVTKEEAASVAVRAPASTPRRGRDAAAPNLANTLADLAQASQHSTLDALTALGRLAQTPAANQIDWPALVAGVAAAAAPAIRQAQRGRRR